MDAAGRELARRDANGNSLSIARGGAHRDPPVARKERARSPVMQAYEHVCVADAARWIPRFVAAILGIALAFDAFGLDFILGRGAFWSYPPGDTETQLTGYRHFVHDTWHWPLLRTTMIAAPEGMNVLFADPVPLVAIPAKLWFHLTGRDPIPFGLWMVACYALQGWFGARLARALGERTIFGGVAAGLMALSAHTFIGRFYHQGLCSQFIILWALAAYFELGAKFSLREALYEWVSLLVLSVLLHPYFTAMTLPIALASLVRGARAALRERCLALGAILGAIAATGVVLGHFSGSSAHVKVSGFGGASLNLVAPFMPLWGHSAFWRDVPCLQEGTGLQWDGSFFLGYGAIALLSSQLVLFPRRLAASVRPHASLVTALGLLTVYALSNRIYLSTHLVASYPLPDVLGPLQQFRSTGRMFWPVGFFLIVATIVFALRSVSRPIGVALVGVVIALHGFDARGALEIVRQSTSIMWAHQADWDEWRAAIRAHARIRQIPSYDCMDGIAGTRVGRESREIQFIAAEESRATNGIRTARPSTDCARELRDYGTPTSEPDTLTLYPRALSSPKDPSLCVAAGLWMACSPEIARPGSDLLTRLRRDEAPSWRADGTLLEVANSDAVSFFDSEWAAHDGDRIWVGAPDGSVRMHITDEKPDDYELAIHALALICGTHLTTTLHVMSRGEELLTHTFTPEDNDPDKPIKATLPRRLVQHGDVRLTFHVDDPIVPAEHGLPGPPRPLGVAVYKLALR